MLTPKAYQQAKTLLLTSAVAGAGIVMTLLTGYVMASPTFGWTGAAMLCSEKRSQGILTLPGKPHSVVRMEGFTDRRHKTSIIVRNGNGCKPHGRVRC